MCLLYHQQCYPQPSALTELSPSLDAVEHGLQASALKREI